MNVGVTQNVHVGGSLSTICMVSMQQQVVSVLLIAPMNMSKLIGVKNPTKPMNMSELIGVPTKGSPNTQQAMVQTSHAFTYATTTTYCDTASMGMYVM